MMPAGGALAFKVLHRPILEEAGPARLSFGPLSFGRGNMRLQDSGCC